MNRTRGIALLAALVGVSVVQGAELRVLPTSPGRLSAEYGWLPARRPGTDGRDIALRRVADGTIRRIDLASGSTDYTLATMPSTAPSVSQSLDQSLDGKIAAWSVGNWAGVFDAVSGVELWRLERSHSVVATVSQTSDRVLLDEAGVGVTLLDLAGQRVRSIAYNGHDPAVVGWSLDGIRLAISWRGQIRCLDARTGLDLGDPIPVFRDVRGTPAPSIVLDLDWHPERP